MNDRHLDAENEAIINRINDRIKELIQENQKLKESIASVTKERNGDWIDEWGACKVCDGEIPHGHSNNCDIYKYECRISEYAAKTESVLKLINESEGCFMIGEFDRGMSLLRKAKLIMEETFTTERRR